MSRTCASCGVQAGDLDILCDGCGAILGTPPEIPVEVVYIPPVDKPGDKRANRPTSKEDWARWRAEIKVLLKEAEAERKKETPPPAPSVATTDVATAADAELARLLQGVGGERDPVIEGAAIGAAIMGAIFPGSRVAAIMGTAFGKYVGSEVKSGAKLVEFGTVGKKRSEPPGKKPTKKRKKSTG